MELIDVNAPVTLIYAAASLLVLLVGLATKGRSDTLLFCVYKSSIFSPLTYVRLIGHVLGHSNIQHYLSNFMFILLLGPMLEDRYGSENLAIMILITAVATGLLFIVFSKRGTAALGASGIVFMMIILSSFINVEQGSIPVTLIIVAIMYIGKEFLGEAAKTLKIKADKVAHLMHIFGGLCGAGIGIFMYLM